MLRPLSPALPRLLHTMLVAGLAWPGLAAAQNQAATLPAAVAAQADAQAQARRTGGELNQAIERVQVDGETVTVKELRVGGETRSISVVPKGGLPAYSVQPRTGERTWKLFEF